MTNGRSNPSVDQQFQTMLVLWIAFLITIVMYAVLTLVLPQTAAPANRLLTVIFSGMCAFLVVVSFPIKSKFLARSVETQSIRDVRTGLILALALCEGAAIMGLLDLLIAQDRYYILLIAFSFLGVLVHFPRRSQLEAASFKSSNTVSE